MSELTDDRLLPCPGCGRNVGAPHDDEGDGIYFVDCAHCGWRGPRAYNLTDAWNRWNRRAAASTSTEGAGVKGLVWQSYPVKELADDTAVMVAPVPIFKHQYQAQRDPWGPGYIVYLHPATGLDTTLWWESKGHDTLDAAKAAAQADYEARIRSALTPPASKVTTDEAEERG